MNNLKKKGTTLIEILIVFAIFSILASSSSTAMGIKKEEEAINTNNKFINEISDILTYGAMYCMKKKSTGTIYQDFNNRRINFQVVKGRETFKLDIPKDYRVSIKSGNSDNKIEIDKDGLFKHKGSIRIENYKRIINISIGVRVFHVNIKKK